VFLAILGEYFTGFAIFLLKIEIFKKWQFILKNT